MVLYNAGLEKAPVPVGGRDRLAVGETTAHKDRGREEWRRQPSCSYAAEPGKRQR